MIPAAFDYVRPQSLEEAVRLLGELGEDARPLAGGHSLLPLMRLRLARPSALVDLEGLPELEGIELAGDRLHIGAMVRHAQLAAHPLVRAHLPLLAEAAAQVGDAQVRNRGTIGGNLAHGDPAADYPAVALALGAEMVTTGRSLRAEDFFAGLFTTALGHGELLREVVFPIAPGPHCYVKHGQRLFEWATVAVAVQRLDDGWRIGLTNYGPVPVRAAACEAALEAGMPAADAARRAPEAAEPAGDLRASARYRRQLAGELTRRALVEAGAP